MIWLALNIQEWWQESWVQRVQKITITILGERDTEQSYFSLFRFTGEFAQRHPAGIWWILNNPDLVPQHQYHLRHSDKASMKQEALFNTRLLGVNTPFTNYSINPLLTHIMSVGSLFLENNHQHFSLEDSNTMNVKSVWTWTVPVNVSNRNFRSQQMSNKLAYLHDFPWCNENNLYSKHILIVDPTNKIYLAKSFRASFGRFHRFGKSWPFWYIWSVNILSWKIQRYFNAGVLRDTLGFVTTDFIQYHRFHSSYTFSSRHYWSIRRCQLWGWRSEAAAKVDQDDFPFCGGWSPNRASVCVPWATTSRKHPRTPLFSQKDRQTVDTLHFTCMEDRQTVDTLPFTCM